MKVSSERSKLLFDFVLCVGDDIQYSPHLFIRILIYRARRVIKSARAIVGANLDDIKAKKAAAAKATA